MVKHGIVPLDGLVETDWLPFPFTMNWRFTRPGTVRFEAGEPFCFVTPAPHALYEAIEPRLRSLADDAEMQAAYEQWSASRTDFNASLARQRARDGEAGLAASLRQRHGTERRGSRLPFVAPEAQAAARLKGAHERLPMKGWVDSKARGRSPRASTRAGFRSK